MPKKPASPISPSTPREEAAASTEKDLSNPVEYAFARKSKFGNFGSDIDGSARHLANQWRGLDDAEKKGTAKDLVNRDSLLKLEPHELSEKMTPKNLDTALSLHWALSRMPSGPEARGVKPDDPDDKALFREWEETQASGAKRSYRTNINASTSASAENVRTITVADLRKEARENYFNVYRSLKDKAHDLASRNVPASAAIGEMQSHVKSLIIDLRKKDHYSTLANSLAGYHNGVLATRKLNAKSAFRSLADFHSKMHGKYPENGLVKQFEPNGQKGISAVSQDRRGPDHDHAGEADYYEKAQNHALSIMEGKSMPAAFGDKGTKKKEFDPADLYVAHALRVGPETGMNHPEQHEEYLRDGVKLSAFQWGNGVTEGEREHHLKHASHALHDLVDVLGLPHEMGSYNGRLGLAIGARGKGRALAHYEPNRKVINLTRKNGVGSLAHEWAHFFDHILGEHSFGGGRKFYSALAQHDHSAPDDRKGVKDAMQAVSTYLHRNMAPRMTEDNNKAGASAVPSDTFHSYWLSTHELFARAFEKHVDHKLKAKGRENTYLTGISDHYLWPNKKEQEELSPLFDRLFQEFERSPYLKKSILQALERMTKSIKSSSDGLRKDTKSFFDILGRKGKKAADTRSRDQKLADALKQQADNGSPYAESRGTGGPSYGGGGDSGFRSNTKQVEEKAPARERFNERVQEGQERRKKDDETSRAQTVYELANGPEMARHRQKVDELRSARASGIEDRVKAEGKSYSTRDDDTEQLRLPGSDRTVAYEGQGEDGSHYFSSRSKGDWSGKHFVMRQGDKEPTHIPESAMAHHLKGWDDETGEKRDLSDDEAVKDYRHSQDSWGKKGGKAAAAAIGKHPKALELSGRKAKVAASARDSLNTKDFDVRSMGGGDIYVRRTHGGGSGMSYSFQKNKDTGAFHVRYARSPEDHAEHAKIFEAVVKPHLAKKPEHAPGGAPITLEAPVEKAPALKVVKSSVAPEGLDKARIDANLSPKGKRQARDERRIAGSGADALAAQVTAKPGVSKAGLSTRAAQPAAAKERIHGLLGKLSAVNPRLPQE